MLYGVIFMVRRLCDEHKRNLWFIYDEFEFEFVLDDQVLVKKLVDEQVVQNSCCMV